MKDNERENDIFDELLRDALASNAAPSDDFTARLMEQVRRTPQEKPLRKQPDQAAGGGGRLRGDRRGHTAGDGRHGQFRC